MEILLADKASPTADCEYPLEKAQENDMDRLETKRLILRSFELTDQDDLCEYMLQRVDAWFEGYPDFSANKAKQETEYRSNSDEFVAIELKENHKVIGNVYIGKRDYGSRELGYVLNEEYQRKGYGTESCRAVIDWLFQQKVPYITAETAPEHIASWKLMEKLGMKRVAHLIQNVSFHNDENGQPIYWDTYVYEIRNPLLSDPLNENANPWKDIDLSDYENHMNQPCVQQLSLLNLLMKEQLRDFNGGTVMILGIAGGNGLEYVKTDKIQTLYGVDVNEKYLQECKNRYPNLRDCLVTIAADLRDSRVALPHADLLIADLLIEYIGYRAFIDVVKRVKPAKVSCVIQKKMQESYISNSPYADVFKALDSVHVQIDTAQLKEVMQSAGYCFEGLREHPLLNGKSLVKCEWHWQTDEGKRK